MSITDAEWEFVSTIATAHAKAEVRRIMQGEDASYLGLIDGLTLASDVFDLTLPDVDESNYSYMEAADVSDVAYEAAHTVLSNAIISERYA